MASGHQTHDANEEQQFCEMSTAKSCCIVAEMMTDASRVRGTLEVRGKTPVGWCLMRKGKNVPNTGIDSSMLTVEDCKSPLKIPRHQ